MLPLVGFEPTKPWFLAKYVCQFHHSDIENRKLKHQKVRVVRLRLDYMNIIKHRRLFPLDKDVLSELSPLASFQIPTSALTVRRNLSFAIKVLVYCTVPRLFCGVSIKFTIHIIPFIIHPDKCQITKPRNYLHKVIKAHRVDFISGTHHLNRHHL